MNAKYIIPVLFIALIFLSGCTQESSDNSEGITDITKKDTFGDFKVTPLTFNIDEEGQLHITGKVKNIGTTSKKEIKPVFRFYDIDGKDGLDSVQYTGILVKPGDEFEYEYYKPNLKTEYVQKIKSIELERVDSYDY